MEFESEDYNLSLMNELDKNDKKLKALESINQIDKSLFGVKEEWDLKSFFKESQMKNNFIKHELIKIENLIKKSSKIIKDN